MKKSRRKMTPESISPSPPKKKVQTTQDPKAELFKSIILELKTTNTPTTVQFRLREKEEILDFVRQNLKNKSESSTMIVFGQPGLGKTLILKEVSRQLSKDSEAVLSAKNSSQRSQLKVKSYYFNAMNYVNCSRFIEDLADKFEAEKGQLGTQYRLEELKKTLENTVKTTPVLLVIDELETLSFHESDFSFVFDLLNINIPGFVKIGISNTIELFTPSQDKGVMYLAFRFLVFKPYNAEQLQGVLQERLERANGDNAIEIWPSSTIEFLVKKTITSQASDVRFVLTSAQEITEQKVRQNDFSPVTIREVIAFFDQKFKTNLCEVVKRMSYQAQVLLMAIFENLAEFKDYIPVANLNKRFYEVLDVLSLDASERVSDLVEMLETYNLVKVENKGSRTKRVQTLRSCLMKEELRQLLSQISLFKRFFNQTPSI